MFGYIYQTNKNFMKLMNKIINGDIDEKIKVKAIGS